MKKKTVFLFVVAAVACGAAAALLTGPAEAQNKPSHFWTLLPKAQMNEIIGEASGESALATVQDIAAYMRDRRPEEYAGTLWESEAMLIRLKRYGFADAELIKYPAGETWDAIRGSLWEVNPERRKLAAIEDNIAMLASGSTDTEVTAELVWVGNGSPAEIAAANVEGKIVVTTGYLNQVYRIACAQKGGLGIVGIMPSQTTTDPFQMSWARVGRSEWEQPDPAAAKAAPAPSVKFGFQLPAREGEILKQRLMRGEKITVQAKVKSSQVPYNMEVVTAVIPGTDPNAGEIIFSAHSFEGISKQGANDNTSGSAAILESARILKVLTDEGRLPKPKRTIRFLWGPEFSGTGKWVAEHKDIMARTLCNINMDMVGEWLSKNQAFFCLMRTTFGNPHYINDVMENIYRFVGDGSRDRLQNAGTAFRVPVRTVSPFGADEPLWYAIEPHFGSSDHEVFNDWGVGVPGIMMIAWPDRWYHTSGDTADKSDATQLKRAALIGAAGAYTIAGADDAMAVRIAGETASNAAQRLGRQMISGLEELNVAAAAGLDEAYRAARADIDGAVINEKETLDSVLQLAGDKVAVGAYLAAMKKNVEALGAAHLASIRTHMETTAKRLGRKPVEIVLSDLEKKAAKIHPRATARVKEGGYDGYGKYLEAVPKEEQAKFPYKGEVADTTEVELLSDGRHSVLEIKAMLDAQFPKKSTVQGIMNYLQILKSAGLVEY